MSTTVTPAKKAPTVTVTMTVTYSAKADMTMAEFTAEADKANKFADEARKLGTVKGSVKIGSQKFKL
jgi:hypothetical protein